VVLGSVVLDLLPHLLDGAIEGLVCLLLRSDEVVGFMGRVVGWAARLL
jgi:hypothetical protein